MPTTPDTALRPGAENGITAVLVGSASFLDSSAIVGVGLGLALWRADFGLSLLEVGLVGSMMGLCVGLGALLGGWGCHHWGLGRVFLATMATYTAAAVAVAFASGPTSLVLATAGLGLASGADLPASLTILSTNVPRSQRARAVAQTHVLWIVGVVTTTAVGLGVSTTGLTGIRDLFLALAAVAAATCLGRLRHLGTASERPAIPARVGSRRRLLTDPRTARPLLLLGCFYVCITVVTNTFGTYRTYLTIVTTGATQREATAVSLAMTVVVLSGSVWFARVVGDRDRRRVLFVCGAVLLTGGQLTIALGGAGTVAGLLLALMLFSLGVPYAGDGIYKVWIHEAFDEGARASAQGTTYAAARIVAAGVALVTPALLDASPAALFSGLTVLAAAAGVIGLWATTLREHADERPPQAG